MWYFLHIVLFIVSNFWGIGIFSVIDYSKSIKFCDIVLKFESEDGPEAMNSCVASVSGTYVIPRQSILRYRNVDFNV
ncbi:MAG: hypothetical protein DRN71_00475 [Candidatus Nanohalarchaeota archaeon]|nr:MAG: hypothetical protein DRN71_00475 [Candidatus Nanohaloarchaeota archaeon]